MLRKYAGVEIALLCWLLVVAIGLVFRQPFLELENKLFDARMRLPHRVKPCNQIVYVDIDDGSMAFLGRWPWPRSQIARIVRTLSRAKIRGTFIDILFSEETTAAEDLALIQALEDSENIFLGVGVQLQKHSEHFPPGQSVDAILEAFCYDLEVENDARVLRATRTVAPIPSLMAIARGLGHISFVPDEDGVARHLPVVIDMGGRYFPSIDIEVARMILDVKQENVGVVPGRYVLLKDAKPPGTPHRTDVHIPVDEELRMLINYGGRWADAFAHYSLHTILRDLLSENDLAREEAESLLADKFVILSAAFTGATDMGPTPLEPLVPLSEIHGHVISSIVNQHFLKRVPVPASMSVALLFCLLLGLLSPRLKTLHFSGLSASLMGLWILFAFALFATAGLVVDIVWPGTAIVLSYAGCAGYSHLKTERERASLRKAFSHYVSPNVLSQILEDPNKLRLGGERVNLSILVLVLDKFERFSENAEPEEIIELLTSIYEKACEAIWRYGGTIDRFTKDGLIAFFGAPISQEDHSQSAARAALSMKHELAEIAASRSQRGQKTVGTKMAINTGFATVGNIGSSERMDYTVIGKNVNLCLRMAQAATEGQILVTRKTYQNLENLIDAEESGEVRFDPYPKPFFILNVIGLKEPSEPVPVPSAKPPTDMHGKKFLGPYTLVEKLGVGNTGTVYKGYDELLDRPVAIKVLFPALLRKDRMPAIAEEAKTLAKLSHPNIVQVYYAGEEDEIGFLVMEFVDGVNVRELVNTEGSLSLGDALDIIVQTCRGLNAAHKQGIIHRDIKPANLLVDSYGVVKVADFGLAGAAVAQDEEGGRVAGTFLYISPEQAGGLNADCRSDIYSLGITFFHLLAGQPPFRADSMAGLVWLHAESELPVEPLREKGVPESVIALIQKMTAKAPDERCADYLDLLKELDKVEAEILS
ncbi:MAG: CHASE2 domain-containing protein [Candidatus Hydrogenedentota bacterium]|nr:MAG: CHASE2 domain-containing protein [Candidatus Hydrogenedentota bacterium]